MKDRIRQIMESQHMTQQVFAQFIGMSPASLSSIFNDRTKPSLNIVEAIRKKIPDISLDWLMFGSGPMYLASKTAETPDLPSPAKPETVQDQILDFAQSSSPTLNPAVTTPENHVPLTASQNSVKSTRQISPRDEVKIFDKPQRRVTEIRIYYDDQTWESFTPSKK